jgi:hypothetical protein
MILLQERKFLKGRAKSPTEPHQRLDFNTAPPEASPYLSGNYFLQQFPNATLP